MVVSGNFLAGFRRRVLRVNLDQYWGVRHSLLEGTGLTDTEHQDITFCYRVPFENQLQFAILLKPNKPLQLHLSVSSLRCLWVAWVAVAQEDA